MNVEVRVLGRLEVTRDGHHVELPGPRERSLLALLAARAPKLVPSDHLIEDLWGEEPPAGCRGTLRSYISTLRRSLREQHVTELVQTRSSGYALALEHDDALDAHAFTALLDGAELRRRSSQRSAEAMMLQTALSLWRGRAFDDVASIAGVAAQARRLEESRLHALERWAEAELACGRHAELAVALAGLCAEQPLRERLWAARITALYRCGRHADALDAYRELYRRLRDDLGITPSPELRQLELDVLNQASGLGPSLPRAGADARRREPVDALPTPLRPPARGSFVGRRQELAALRSAWSLCLAGGGSLVAVRGESGIGKTRLVGEWSQPLQTQGALVMYGQCDSDAESPHQPFLDALAPYARGSDLDRLSSSGAVVRLLCAMSARAPIVLVLDDMHLAGPRSLSTLAELGRRAGRAPLMVVATLTDAKIAERVDPRHRPEPSDAESLLAGTLARAEIVAEIVLGGLDEPDVAAMVADSGLQRRDQAINTVARRLHAVSGGNPLLVHRLLARMSAATEARAEEVRHALEAGAQALEQGSFTQAASAADRGLAALDRQRAEDPRTRCELALLLARSRLLGRDVPGAKLAARDAGELARVLGDGEQVIQAALVCSYLNVVGLPDAHTEGLCRDALEVLEHTGRPETIHVLAGWADYVAFSESDAPRAERLSARAVELARTIPDAEARHRALFVHGEVLACAGQLAQRVRLAGELLRSARERGDSHGQASAWHQLALARVERGDLAGFDQARTDMRTANSRAGYWYLEMYDNLWHGMRAMLEGRLDEVEAHSERLLAHADTDPNVANLYMGQIFCLRREQLRIDELLDALSDVVAANPAITAFRCALALAHAEGGRLEPAREQLTVLARDGFARVPRDTSWTTSLSALSDVAADLDDRESAATLHGLLRPYAGRLLLATKGLACLGAADRLLGRLEATLGQWEEAEVHFAGAARLETAIGSRLLLARTQLSHARALEARGRPQDSPRARELALAAGHARESWADATSVRIGERGASGRPLRV